MLHVNNTRYMDGHSEAVEVQAGFEVVDALLGSWLAEEVGGCFHVERAQRGRFGAFYGVSDNSAKIAAYKIEAQDEGHTIVSSEIYDTYGPFGSYPYGASDDDYEPGPYLNIRRAIKRMWLGAKMRPYIDDPWAAPIDSTSSRAPAVLSNVQPAWEQSLQLLGEKVRPRRASKRAGRYKFDNQERALLLELWGLAHENGCLLARFCDAVYEYTGEELQEDAIRSWRRPKRTLMSR